MRSNFPIIALSCFFMVLMSCGKPKETGTFIYIEVEQMDPRLENCFSERLYDHWASPEDMALHSMSVKYTGAKPEDKHIFKSYDEFDMDKDKTGTLKIMIRADPSQDTTHSSFQLRMFELVPEGLWMQRLSLSEFRLQDRPNDTKNPGKVDNEEICDQMVRYAIKASFKPLRVFD